MSFKLVIKTKLLPDVEDMYTLTDTDIDIMTMCNFNLRICYSTQTNKIQKITSSTLKILQVLTPSKRAETELLCETRQNISVKYYNIHDLEKKYFDF